MIRSEPFKLAEVDRLLSWVAPTQTFLVHWGGRRRREGVKRECRLMDGQ